MPDTTKTDRHFCPRCHRERTGDTLTMPCACMREPKRKRRRLTIPRPTHLRVVGDLFA